MGFACLVYCKSICYATVSSPYVVWIPCYQSCVVRTLPSIGLSFSSYISTGGDTLLSIDVSSGSHVLELSSSSQIAGLSVTTTGSASLTVNIAGGKCITCQYTFENTQFLQLLQYLMTLLLLVLVR